MSEKKVTGFDHLWCALYACAAFPIEILLQFIEKKIGIDVSSYTVSQNIIHWIITSVIWIAAGVLIIFIGKKTTGFDIWKHQEKLRLWQYAAIGACFVIGIAVKYLDWNGFKVILEWQSRGPVLFVFQYIYYLAEGFLISLVIVFGQMACEKWFKNEKIPYGGIILAATWGISHAITQESILIGLLAALGGFLFGTAYLFMNKDYRKALPIITLLFIL